MEITTLPVTDSGATLTCYLQQPSEELEAVARKPAMLVLPGGGYQYCSDREAEPIALAYAARGFQTFVLRYSTGAEAAVRKPLAEASAAIGLIRRRASEFHLLPGQVFAAGFSAGGHLAGWVALAGEHRPDAIVLGYPAAQLYAPKVPRASQPATHLLKCLLGGDWRVADAQRLNLAALVGRNAVPMFCWSTGEDTLTTPGPVLELASAYARFGRPFELHLYQFGGHALALADHNTADGRAALADAVVAGWLDLSVAWLRRNFGAPVLDDRPPRLPRQLAHLFNK